MEDEELHLGRVVAVLMLAEDLHHFMACLHRAARKAVVVFHLSINFLLVEAHQEVVAECVLAIVRLLQDMTETCVLLEDATETISWNIVLWSISCIGTV